ncbi:UDP-N-acetylmuramoyl-L-alanyl-D-glutamate--2,6-diaminopimelate ligase MurE [Stratiformator vulcanicus]|uniref:UDP-N-acetylmuramoyl-L-alanyl-D-glutamate--2,6-diaminopimelate ligase n=2 Tax=Stratiformator vulcanicus TaxID=2527980 RepID=A0A517R2S6_9PLAN|nr:UDP-N-acetylmuramoyl-L-alanyl-D-glutamate--2,6-diaminopimelate ligase MurE [Stratiformator vulcanicus]
MIASSAGAVSLRRLLPAASFIGSADIGVSHITDRSTDCRPGSVFAALRGRTVDGIDYLDEAISNGACGVLTDRPITSTAVPQCVVSNSRIAYSEVCRALAGRPDQRLRVAGVTGTDGKTSVCSMIRKLLESCGQRCGQLGTVENYDGVCTETSTLTTDEPPKFWNSLSRMTSNRTTMAAVELSSQALDQYRVAGLQLDLAVVTGVTRDHLDYHGTPHAYAAAKGKIFGLVRKGGRAIINNDDPGSRDLFAKHNCGIDAITCSLDGPADLRATDLTSNKTGVRFTFQMADFAEQIQTELIGRHNVMNMLLAAAVAAEFGLAPEQIAAGLSKIKSPPGRLERIVAEPINVFVDYAHTPDALARVVDELKQITQGRLIVVFGAGGGRDADKRPLLGQAASNADLAIVTNDNPRNEHPQTIIEHILAGITSTTVEVRPDRCDAIRLALDAAVPGDCVLIAGKGHETYQEIGTRQISHNDAAFVRRYLSARHPATPITACA